MKRLLSVILLALMLLVMLAPAALANQDAIRDSCVRVFAENSESAWIGTAFAVGKSNEPVRFFVTNRHVVEGASKVSIIFDNSNNMVPCNVEVVSDRCDLAVIVLDSSTNVPRKPAILRTFDVNKELGEKTEAAWAYGYPAFGLQFRSGGTGDDLRADTRTLIVTDGWTSNIGENATTNKGQIIMHTADISGGNSGGPLVDKDGCVLGVNSYKRFGSLEDNTASSSYAVSVNEVVRLLDSEKIPYTTKQDVRNRKFLIIALIAAGVIVVGVVVALLLTRGKGKGGATSKGGRRTLVCEAGDLAGHAPFEIRGTVTIGRDQKHPNIAFPKDARGVSGLHCTIMLDKGVVKVRDENSSYGTWIDSVKLQPGVPTVMHRGQKLYLGSKKQAFTLRS